MALLTVKHNMLQREEIVVDNQVNGMDYQTKRYQEVEDVVS